MVERVLRRELLGCNKGGGDKGGWVRSERWIASVRFWGSVDEVEWGLNL